MMRRTHLQEKPLSSSSQGHTKSQFAPRPFAPPVEVREAPSAESLERAARFGHSFADISILPRETVQPKLVLGPVGDKYEQEADEVARRVVETISYPVQDSVQRQEDEDEDELDLEELEEEAAVQRQMAGAISSPEQDSVQRQEDLEDEDELDLEEDEELRRKVAGFAPAGSADIEPGLESAIHRARSGGQPLSDRVRQPMERAFGTDFGSVRVHTDGQADSLNRSIQARAFTTGHDIFFRQGDYRPGSSGGQKLLAHELTHVVQQNGGAVRHKAAAGTRLLQAKWGESAKTLMETFTPKALGATGTQYEIMYYGLEKSEKKLELGNADFTHYDQNTQTLYLRKNMWAELIRYSSKQLESEGEMANRANLVAIFTHEMSHAYDHLVKERTIDFSKIETKVKGVMETELRAWCKEALIIAQMGTYNRQPFKGLPNEQFSLLAGWLEIKEGDINDLEIKSRIYKNNNEFKRRLADYIRREAIINSKEEWSQWLTTNKDWLWENIKRLQTQMTNILKQIGFTF